MHCYDFKRNNGETMRILLINASPVKDAVFGEPQAFYPPLGILYIASYLRKNGYTDISVIDGAKIGFKKTIDKIKREKFDIVGISSTTWACIGALKLSNFIRSMNKDVPIVIGGPHATAYPTYFLDDERKIVVVGEGEETFLDIVRRFEKGILYQTLNEIDGIAYIKDNRIIYTKPRRYLNINDIPFPARDLVDIRSYPGLYWSKYQPETHIITSRGCPFHCFFCSDPVWRTNIPWYRMRNPENIKEELLELKYKFNIKEISDESDTFNVDLKWAKEVPKVIGEVGIPWKVQMRVDRIDREFAKILYKSNCWMVRVGIESGNQETLDGIGKMINLKMVVRGLRKLKEYNIYTVGLFMGFNVWEEDGKLMFEDYRKTLNTIKFIKKLLKEKLLDSFTFSLTMPFPGARLWETAIKFNLIVDSDYEKFNQSSYFVMKLPGVKKEEIERIKSFATYLQAKTISYKSINPRLWQQYIRKLLLIFRYLI
jgi:magnesium-protoporphyrin IX monomethyl ester (oxidative) cyclase